MRFLFALLCSEVRAVKNLVLTAIGVGLLTSLVIEVLQAFLSARSSGVTDLMTNTLGTVTGALIYNSRPAQSLLTQVRQRFGIGVELGARTSADCSMLSEDRVSMPA